ALFGRKADADRVNHLRLGALPGEEQVFPTEYQGEETAIAQLQRAAPIAEALLLKEGALVMIRQNDYRGRWANGTQGLVRTLPTEALPKVGIELSGGEYVEIEKTAFHLFNAEGRKAATARNYPLSLAYA